MKTKSFFIAALFILTTSIVTLAKENPAIHKGLAVVSVKGTDVFKIIYKAERAGKVKLKVYNEASELVFSESFTNTDSFIRPLNLAALCAGEYTIELKDKDGKKIQKVTIKQTLKKGPAMLAAIE